VASQPERLWLIGAGVEKFGCLEPETSGSAAFGSGPSAAKHVPKRLSPRCHRILGGAVHGEHRAAKQQSTKPGPDNEARIAAAEL